MVKKFWAESGPVKRVLAMCGLVIAVLTAGGMVHALGQGVTAFVIDMRVDTALRPLKGVDSALAMRIQDLEHDSLSKSELDTLKWQIYREFAEIKATQAGIDANLKLVIQMLERR